MNNLPFTSGLKQTLVLAYSSVQPQNRQKEKAALIKGLVKAGLYRRPPFGLGLYHPLGCFIKRRVLRERGRTRR